jgi:hypothetical protein
MRWFLVDLAMIVLTLLALGLCALGVWRKVGVVRAAAGELKDGVANLSAETSVLSARLDAAEVSARLAERAG